MSTSSDKTADFSDGQTPADSQAQRAPANGNASAPVLGRDADTFFQAPPEWQSAHMPPKFDWSHVDELPSALPPSSSRVGEDEILMRKVRQAFNGSPPNPNVSPSKSQIAFAARDTLPLATSRAVAANSSEIEFLQEQNLVIAQDTSALLAKLNALSTRLDGFDNEVASQQSSVSSKGLCVNDLERGMTSFLPTQLSIDTPTMTTLPPFVTMPYTFIYVACVDDEPTLMTTPTFITPSTTFIPFMTPYPSLVVMPNPFISNMYDRLPGRQLAMTPHTLLVTMPHHLINDARVRFPPPPIKTPLPTCAIILTVRFSTPPSETHAPATGGGPVPAYTDGGGPGPASAAHSVRPHLIPPSARSFIYDDPTPLNSQSSRNSGYGEAVVSCGHVNDKAINRFITDVKPVLFDGVPIHWQPVEDCIHSFLRAHGISHVLQKGYLKTKAFRVEHNQALYKFLFQCVSKSPSPYAVLKRAPLDDGHTAHCFLSQKYGVRDPAAITMLLQVFAPYDAEKPLEMALRLEDLYNDLDLAGKPTPEWERVEKLLNFLEGFPQMDYGAVYSRIEDQLTCRGITYREATSWVAKRQSTLEHRAALKDIVPRSRPTYLAGTSTGSSAADTAPTPAPDNATLATIMQLLTSAPARAEQNPAVEAFIAASHRDNPNGRRTGEPDPQTPGLKLRLVARECRVVGCKAPTRSRLCQEHFLQLQAVKVKFLPCEVTRSDDTVETKYAHYHITPAAGSKAEWRGVLFKNEAAHKAAIGE